MSTLRIWVSLPPLDPAMLRAMRVYGINMFNVRGRLRNDVRDAIFRCYGDYVSCVEVRVRRDRAWQELRLQWVGAPSWVQSGEVEEVACSGVGSTIGWLSTLTMKAAMAGKLPERGRYSR